jgi:hypothetical protein
MVPTTGRRKSRKKKELKKKFEEPKIPWKDSDAKKLLYKEIMVGLLIPLEAKDTTRYICNATGICLL